MSKNFKFASLVLSFILCFSALAFGQRTTGDIQGTVTDSTGAVVPGVSITITGVDVGFNRVVQSDSDGVYRVQQIPAGTYKVVAAATKGFAETTLDSVQVNIEKVAAANIVLGVSQNVTTVEVSSDPLGVNVDSTDSKIQTNITDKLIDQLPKGTNFTSLLKVSPGTRSEPLSGGFQVDGASGAENSFVIDGQTVENFRTGTLNLNNNLPTSLVQEIQVKTSGFEAEHGGASGGVITVQTKGGTNSLRGELGTQFEISKFQPGNRFASQVFQNSGSDPQFVYAIRSPRDRFTNTFPTATFGGPIIKNRIWFLGSYSPQVFSTTRTTTFYDQPTTNSFTNVNGASNGFTSGVNLTRSSLAPITYQSSQTNHYAFGRVDASILNNLRVTSTYLWNPVVYKGNIPYGSVALGQIPAANTPNGSVVNGVTYNSDQDYQRQVGGRDNSDNFTSQVVYTPTAKLAVNVRFAHGFLNEKGPLAYGLPSGVNLRCRGTNAGLTTVGNGSLPAGVAITGCPSTTFTQYPTGNSITLRDSSIRNEFNADATYSLSSFFGRHDFKGGYQYGTTKNDVLLGAANTGRLTLQYGRNFNFYGVAAPANTCNLITAANPNGNCYGVGQLYRFGTKGVASNKYQGVFIQDKWQPFSRLTLNLGVRAENENLPAFNTGGSGSIKGIPLNFGFGKKVAPRLGGAYDLFGNGKSRIFASYGWFYDRLKFALPRGSYGGDFYRVDYFPILRSNPQASYYTNSVILGSFSDPIGGSPGPVGNGGISIHQDDLRIPSNLSEANYAALGLPFAGTASDLKPFKQVEFTVGFERELTSQYVLTTRYTRKNIASAIEDHATLGIGGSENYTIGNPGEGTDLRLDQAAGYVKSLKPTRLYNGLEITLNKRFSHNYFYNLNYTLSRLYGNYSGLASSDEPTVFSATAVQGRTEPGVSRYFDYIINGFTYNGTPDNGNLPTDRRHAFKAYGGYNFDWFKSKTNTTEFSFFQQVLQGTPQTTYIGFINTSSVFTRRGDLGRTPTFFQTDLALTHRYRFGKENRFTMAFDFNVLNALNNNSVLYFNTTRYSQNNTLSGDQVDPNYDPNNCNALSCAGGFTGSPTNALNTILSGKFTPAQVDAALAAPNNPRNVLYGKPAVYQNGRNVRFGFRLIF